MFLLKIADITAEIDNKYRFTRDMCSDYIVTHGTAEFSVSVSDEEIACETGDGNCDYTDDYREFIAIYRKICNVLPRFDAFMLHSAVIELDGTGYAFSAPSGTGKSTHILLWRKAFGDGVHIINGDKPIIRKKDGVFTAYGTPWCGKENWGKNASAPLKSLCFLMRSTGNRAEKITAVSAFPELISQIFLPDTEAERTLAVSLAADFAAKTELFNLYCNKDISAAFTAYNAINHLTCESDA